MTARDVAALNHCRFLQRSRRQLGKPAKGDRVYAVAMTADERSTSRELFRDSPADEVPGAEPAFVSCSSLRL